MHRSVLPCTSAGARVLLRVLRLVVLALVASGLPACSDSPGAAAPGAELDADGATPNGATDGGVDVDEPEPYECSVDSVPVEVTVEHYGIDAEGQLVPPDCPELGFSVYTGVEGKTLGLGRIDGGYILAGVTGGAEDCVAESGEVYGSEDDVVLVWLDDQANVVEARRYGHQLNEQLKAMAVADDGTVLFATTNKSSNELVASGPVLTRIAPSGAVEWRASYPVEGLPEGSVRVHSIAALPGTAPAEFVIGARIHVSSQEQLGLIGWLDGPAVEEAFVVYEHSAFMTSVAPGPAGELAFSGNVHIYGEEDGNFAGVFSADRGLEWLSLLPDTIGVGPINTTVAWTPAGDLVAAELFGTGWPQQIRVALARDGTWLAELVVDLKATSLAVAAGPAVTLFATTVSSVGVSAISVSVFDEQGWPVAYRTIGPETSGGVEVSMGTPPPLIVGATRNIAAVRLLHGGVGLLRLDAWGQGSCEAAGACRDLTIASCADADPCTVTQCDPDIGCVASVSWPLDEQPSWDPNGCAAR